MRTFIYMFFIILFAMPVFAKKVDVETAKFAAKNLYYLRVNQINDVKLSQINLSLIYTEIVNNEPVYYVFNINTNEGFVIISADDIAKPCIGYGFEGAYQPNNLPSSFNFLMGTFRDQIAQAVSQKSPPSPEATTEWNKLLTNNPTKVKTLSTLPLLINTWNQDWPYNELCPADAASTAGGHVYVGCVATAMVQCMKFYNYPTTGLGSHTNPSLTNGGYGNQTVNYANQTYIWENMPNTISTSSTEVAKIGFHASVAVNMNYGPDGSGSQTSYIPGALTSHFKYSSNCQYLQKPAPETTANQATWEAMLINQVNNKWPMVYQGRDSTSGHAWNCDGYISGTTNEFHMNWGWGGSANGYFSVSGAIVSGGGYTFDQGFGAVINIYPAANYPVWCAPTTKLISGTAGTFNDGSGNQNYLDNQNCLYLIQPPCASFVTLSFDRFDLGTGDIVKVYDGATTSSPLLATYDASNLPSLPNPSPVIAVSGSEVLLVQFITDGSSNATGWYASYNTMPCKSAKTLTDPSGTIVDGSKTCDYAGSLGCTWTIDPGNVNSFQLNFTEFNLAADPGDNVKVYKNAIFGGLIGTYTSTNIPTTLNIAATKVIIKFNTNSSLASAGWAINYSSTLTGIENNLTEFSTGIYPNPFSNDATITYTLTDVTDVKITVTNVLGKVVGTYNKQEVSGAYRLPLSSFTEQLSQGMYFVNLSFNDKETTVKIVCTK